jgi:peptidyl-prolyl cis-trans isomerase A (cyclophilin A)
MRSSAIRLASIVLWCATATAGLAIAQLPQAARRPSTSLGATLSAQSESKGRQPQAVPSPDKEFILTPGTYARFTTSEGDFTVRLFEDRAPETVANFVGLAEGTKDPATGKPGQVSPFYDGLVFHRIIAGFMIQGGDPKGDGRGGPGYTFVDEFDPTLRFDRPGLLAMANRGPNTNTSQFFIMLRDNLRMPKNYTIFGKVIKGIEVVDKIGEVEIDPQMGATDGKPKVDVVMKKVTIRREPWEGAATGKAPEKK